MLKEAEKLLNDHWKECAGWKDKIFLNPDWEKYQKLQDLGIVKPYELRIDGELNGYIVILFNNHLHYKDDIFAHVDVLFVSEKARKGMSAIRFMKYVEKEMRNLGASVMSYHIKIQHDYPALFKRLGYEPNEKIYAKCLKG